MDPNEEKYEKVIGILKMSKPEIRHPEILTDRIMSGLRKKPAKEGIVRTLSNFFFGWVYIGWVRNSMIVFSTAILIIFIWQQSIIIRRINEIDRPVVPSAVPEYQVVSGRADARMLLRRIENVLPAGKKDLSRKEIDELIESIDKLQIKYRDLILLMQDDPELKKYVENKLNENSINRHNP